MRPCSGPAHEHTLRSKAKLVIGASAGANRRAADRACTITFPPRTPPLIGRRPPCRQAQLMPDGLMHFRGLVASPDGQKIFRVERKGAPADFLAMGKDAGAEVRREAGEAFFEELQRYVQSVQAANTKPTKVAK
jgi:porphobilinogen deaminase